VSDLAATVANLRRLRDEAKLSVLRVVDSDGERPTAVAMHVGTGPIPDDIIAEALALGFAYDCDEVIVDDAGSEARARLIVAAVNALPTLLDAVERGERAMALLAKGLDAEAECEVAVPEDPPCGTCWTCEVKAFLAALTAKPR